jgi:polar amino acid transport system substrate-binding protein
MFILIAIIALVGMVSAGWAQNLVQTNVVGTKDLKLVTEEYPPLTFSDGEGVSGYATQIVREIMNVLDVKAEIKVLPWEEAYQVALKEDNVVIFTIERTPQREKLFHWVGPLGENSASFYVSPNSSITFSAPDEARKLRSIAVVSSWFTEQQLLDMGFDNLISTNNPQECIRMVVDGAADATVLTDITAPELIKEAGVEPDALVPVVTLTSTEYYLGFSLGTDKEIVASWDNAFNMLKEKGVIKDLKSKWFKEK